MNLGLPDLLRPTEHRPIELPSGRSLDLAHCFLVFPAWTKPADVYTFGGKKLLDCGGAPVFAELYVLRLLQRHGWDGVWVSSYRQKYLRDMPVDPKLSNHVTLEPSREAILRKIAPRGGGCFDVFAWRDDDVLFCECTHMHST
jgi:hypothetical protein